MLLNKHIFAILYKNFASLLTQNPESFTVTGNTGYSTFLAPIAILLSYYKYIITAIRGVELL